MYKIIHIYSYMSKHMTTQTAFISIIFLILTLDWPNERRGQWEIGEEQHWPAKSLLSLLKDGHQER